MYTHLYFLQLGLDTYNIPQRLAKNDVPPPVRSRLDRMHYYVDFTLRIRLFGGSLNSCFPRGIYRKSLGLWWSDDVTVPCVCLYGSGLCKCAYGFRFLSVCAYECRVLSVGIWVWGCVSVYMFVSGWTCMCAAVAVALLYVHV